MLDLQEYFNILVSRISGPNWTVHGESGVLHNKGWIICFQSCLEQEIYFHDTVSQIICFLYVCYLFPGKSWKG